MVIVPKPGEFFVMSSNRAEGGTQVSQSARYQEGSGSPKARSGYGLGQKGSNQISQRKSVPKSPKRYGDPDSALTVTSLHDALKLNNLP